MSSPAIHRWEQHVGFGTGDIVERDRLLFSAPQKDSIFIYFRGANILNIHSLSKSVKRFIEEDLLRWKDSPDRKPLVLKGMRQTGKTYLLRDFGRRHFPDCAYFNFEGNARLARIFDEDLDVDRILRELSMVHGRTITPETLVIFDEVQFCYGALTSLKYFCEQRREYHIACAGSLLGLRLSRDRRGDGVLSFPVGKVDLMRLRPMTFAEFVLARDGELMLSVLTDARPFDPLAESAMPRLRDLYLEYLCVGGMPEAVSVWVSEGDMDAVERVHRNLLASFENDLARHCGESFGRISRVWSSVAVQVAEDGDRFRLKEAGGTSSTLSGPIEWLLGADLVHRVWEVNDDRTPPNPRGGIYYKLYFGDVGLLRTKAGMTCESILSHDAPSAILRGALAENFALLELNYALGDDRGVFFWKNEKGKAEVDFVVSIEGANIPIEVRSGKLGRIQSLETYCSRYGPDLAVVASHGNVRGPADGGWLLLPLYLLWRLPDYADAVRQG